MLFPICFILVLAISMSAVNKKNNAQLTDENLSFSWKDNAILFLCFLISILLNAVMKNFDTKVFMVSLAIYSFVMLLVVSILNMNREKAIKKKHDSIIQAYQALGDIFGKVDVQSIDFANIPFELSEDPKTKLVNEISIDTTMQGIKIGESNITLAQYSINKYFPEMQWISIDDKRNRRLLFKGLPKPPKIAMFPGSDYRPTEWIPLGLSGKGEVGWNLADPKDMGNSSFIYEDGAVPESVDMPSAPQALCVGSTGGGKSIYINETVQILQ